MESHELLMPVAVEESAGTNHPSTAATATVEWSEEERRNVVTFFTLLDQWDRDFREKMGAA